MGKNRPHYVEITPCEALASYVQCYWMIGAEQAAGVPNRILPDGCIDILVNLGDPVRPAHDPSAALRTCAVGAMLVPEVVVLSGRIDLLGIRFRPGGAFPFLDTAVNELTDRTVDIDDLWKNASVDVEARLSETATRSERIAAVEQWLLRRLRAAPVLNAPVRYAVSRIQKTQGGISVRHLENDLGVSERHLERLFQIHVGMSPKTFARVTRFQSAAALLQNHPHVDGATAALQSGYYDQAHFIRDFKAFSGLTPSAYAAERLDVGFVQYGGTERA